MKIVPAQNLIKIINKGPEEGGGFYPYWGEIPDWLTEQKKRLNFERLSLQAARSGDFHLALVDTLLPLSALVNMGFGVREIVRNDALLDSLEKAAESADFRATASADKFIFNHPNFKLNEPDGFFHRNTLLSLLHGLWSDGVINEDTGTFDLESHLKKFTNITDDLILSNRFLLKSIVDDFKSFKMAIGQAECVRQDHSRLFLGVKKAFLISWDSVASENILDDTFSPQLLFWYASYWPGLVSWLNKSFESQAKTGSCEASFDISEIKNDWVFQDAEGELEEMHVKKFPWSLLYQELLSSGYTVMPEFLKADEDYSKPFSPGSELKFSRGDVLSIRVGWN